MRYSLFRWLLRNIGTILTAFLLALLVWISAVTTTDPNVERSIFIPIEITGLRNNIEIIDEIPELAELHLFAPASIFELLDAREGAIRVWLDITNIEPGLHTIKVDNILPTDLTPLRLESISPESIQIRVEEVVSRQVKITPIVRGEPTLGYQAGKLSLSDTEATVTGRKSIIDSIEDIPIVVDISGASESLNANIALRPIDTDGNVVNQVTISPNRVTLRQPISLKGGYRNVVIRVMTTGQVASGFRQTSISASPPSVLVFSANPNLVDQLPGYIETISLDLDNASDDIETILGLNLPSGISVVGDPNILVQIGVAALEGTIRISRLVEVIGLPPSLQAEVSPDTVDVLLYGPIPLLEDLKEVDVRLIIDLTDVDELGVYQMNPTIEILSDLITAQSLTPELVEITIITAPTPEPTSTP